jgi:hypothetical protein
MVLHAVTLLVQQRLAQDVDRYRGTIDLRVAPPLCPLQVSPADFSHARELISRAYESTRRWLEEPAVIDDRAPLRLHGRRLRGSTVGRAPARARRRRNASSVQRLRRLVSG